MCYPILTIAGGLISAASSVAAGNAKAQAYNAKAKVAEQNARLAELQGIRALEAGSRQEKQLRREGRAQYGSQLAQAAASGITVTGSASNILADTKMGIEEDADALRMQTLQEKWGYDVQGSSFRNEASAARSSAKNARTSGWIGAVSGLVGTAGNIFSNTPKNVPTPSTSGDGQIRLYSGQPGDPEAFNGYYRRKY